MTPREPAQASAPYFPTEADDTPFLDADRYGMAHGVIDPTQDPSAAGPPPPPADGMHDGICDRNALPPSYSVTSKRCMFCLERRFELGFLRMGFCWLGQAPAALASAPAPALPPSYSVTSKRCLFCLERRFELAWLRMVSVGWDRLLRMRLRL